MKDHVDAAHDGAAGALMKKRLARKRRPSVTLSMNDVTAAALDREAAAQGLPDRVSVVRQAVEKYLSSQARRRQVAADERERRAEFTGNGREIFEAESVGSHTYRCRVSAREAISCGNPHKHLWVRLYHPVDEERFPSRPRQEVYIQRGQLPWLIDALQGAEAALQEDTRRIRAEAQALRAALPKEERARQQELRAEYVRRYSQERVEAASKLASSHRTRARGYGQSEHFTAWEWLDLCNVFGFRCPLCGEDDQLSPHHAVALSRGGGNTIENILSLCPSCHDLVHEARSEYSPDWLARQQVLCREVVPGSVVEYRQPDPYHRSPATVLRAVVMSVAEPAPTGAIEDRLIYDAARHALVVEGSRVRPWSPAKVQVRPLGYSNEHEFDLDAVTKLEPNGYAADQDAWLVRQTDIYGRFKPGDRVSFKHRNVVPHGTVMRLVASDIGPSWGQVEGIAGPWADLWTYKTPAVADMAHIEGASFRERLLELDKLRAIEMLSDPVEPRGLTSPWDNV